MIDIQQIKVAFFLLGCFVGMAAGIGLTFMFCAFQPGGDAHAAPCQTVNRKKQPPYRNMPCMAPALCYCKDGRHAGAQCDFCEARARAEAATMEAALWV
jgi:hypothetical protein